MFENNTLMSASCVARLYCCKKKIGSENSLRDSAMQSCFYILSSTIAYLKANGIDSKQIQGPGESQMEEFVLNRSLTSMTKEVEDMFDFAFEGYMRYGFPSDDLRPISCTSSNSQGGIALTLLDSLDTLYLLGKTAALRKAVLFVSKSLNFDINARVHVFEVTIRGIGGLLSCHAFLHADKQAIPWYKGELLDKAVELADKLLPAFDTPTGIPTSWINLQRGQVPGDTRVTCTACAGTMLLEFGVLSRMTGNPVYEAKAKHAVISIYEKRSNRDLLGNTINVDNGGWVRRTSGIGAGIDSFYEYLLKSYLAFGDAEYLEMFSTLYAAIQANNALSKDINGVTWPVDVHMTSGRIVHPYISSLSAFWPGLQALSGQVEEAKQLYESWSAAASVFGWLPEMFSVALNAVHPTMRYYPLRPELIESSYILYSITGNKVPLHRMIQFHDKLRNSTRTKCGFASISDVLSGKLEDSMESFFLSETLKYLYLAFSNQTSLLDHFIFSTEAHVFPIFPLINSSNDMDAKYLVNNSQYATSSDFCFPICNKIDQIGLLWNETMILSGHRDWESFRRMLERRCVACIKVNQAVKRARLRAWRRWSSAADNPEKVSSPISAPQQWAYSRRYQQDGVRTFLCLLYESPPKTMTCSYLKEIAKSSLTSQSIQALPFTSVFIEIFEDGQKDYLSMVERIIELEVTQNNSGIVLPCVQTAYGEAFRPECNASDSKSIENSKNIWKNEMALRFMDDTEEESLYQHEVELTNEEILERIELHASIHQTHEKNHNAINKNEMRADPGQISSNNMDESLESKQNIQKPEESSSGICDISSTPILPLCDIHGTLVSPEPPDGCTVPTTSAEILKDSIALVQGIGCSLEDKVSNLVPYGVKAILMMNNSYNPDAFVDFNNRLTTKTPILMLESSMGERLVNHHIGHPVRLWKPSVLSRHRHAKRLLQKWEGSSDGYSLDISDVSESPSRRSNEYGVDQCLWSHHAFEISSEDPVRVHLDFVVPIGSQAFVLSHFYQTKSNFSPVFEAVSNLWSKTNS